MEIGSLQNVIKLRWDHSGLKWTLILVRRRNRYTREERHVKSVRYWSYSAITEGMPRVASFYQNLERSTKEFFPRASERLWPCWHLDFRPLVLRIVRQYISSVWSHRVCGNFLIVALGNEHSILWLSEVLCNQGDSVI